MDDLTDLIDFIIDRWIDTAKEIDRWIDGWKDVER